jgi:hypothetical protein
MNVAEGVPVRWICTCHCPGGGMADAEIAKNCRTSVEMIEKYYTAHSKTNLDAAEINKMRPKKKQNQPKTRWQPNPETEGKFRLPAL